MKVSEICKIINDCDRLRDILIQDKHTLTSSEIQEICDLLWDYRVELLNTTSDAYQKSIGSSYRPITFYGPLVISNSEHPCNIPIEEES